MVKLVEIRTSPELQHSKNTANFDPTMHEAQMTEREAKLREGELALAEAQLILSEQVDEFNEHTSAFNDHVDEFEIEKQQIFKLRDDLALKEKIFDLRVKTWERARERRLERRDRWYLRVKKRYHRRAAKLRAQKLEDIEEPTENARETARMTSVRIGEATTSTAGEAVTPWHAFDLPSGIASRRTATTRTQEQGPRRVEPATRLPPRIPTVDNQHTTAMAYDQWERGNYWVSPNTNTRENQVPSSNRPGVWFSPDSELLDFAEENDL
ncbi:hypothetical protein EDC01DRAFT_634586 [Geopyxis carbonaria]|nr:hypothetical protein EDC01DRAFT_634586 [Geopyxis carbonaria]